MDISEIRIFQKLKSLTKRYRGKEKFQKIADMKL